MKKIKKRTTHAPAKKRSSIKQIRRKNNTASYAYTRYLIIGFALLFVFFVGNNALNHIDKPYVLGTSVMLAQDGSDIPTPSDTNNNNSQTPQNFPSSQPTNPSEIKQHGQSNTVIDCVGPDGNHSQTSYQNCASLNRNQGRSSFSFTPLKPSTTWHTASTNAQMKPLTQELLKKYAMMKDKLAPSGMPTSNEKVHINLQEGKPVVKTQSPDGSETTLVGNDAMNKLNDDLKRLDMEIESSGAGSFAFKKGNVETQTKLPISFDPTTQQMTVTTSTGSKTMDVFPDQAVERALQTGLINSIESQASTNATNEATTLQKTVLSQVNNEPVFQISGFSNKKVLGLVPVSFAKTVFVSAQNGRIVKTDETFLSKLLETLSF